MTRTLHMLPVAIAAAGLLLAIQNGRHVEPALFAAYAIASPSERKPVLVELYQSQGCSSCPPANANLNAIANRPDVVALSFGVTYWDQLGWKDSFASPQYTTRQWDYARFNHRSNVATPQVWVNGRETLVGDNAGQLAAVIRRARDSGPTISVAANRVELGTAAAPRANVDVWLARYDPRTIEVAIRAGENGGRTLPHKNIVKSLVKIGSWTGQAVHFALPKATGGLASAVFLQAGTGGPVLAAAKG